MVLDAEMAEDGVEDIMCSLTTVLQSDLATITCPDDAPPIIALLETELVRILRSLEEQQKELGVEEARATAILRYFNVMVPNGTFVLFH